MQPLIVTQKIEFFEKCPIRKGSQDIALDSPTLKLCPSLGTQLIFDEYLSRTTCIRCIIHIDSFKSQTREVLSLLYKWEPETEVR